MSIRARLLLLSLLTLGLPWAGCQYARQMERALRVGQEEALLTTARTVARFIAADPDALYRSDAMRTSFEARAGDVFAPRLAARPPLDGYADEWPATLPAQGAAPLRAGIVGGTLYLFASFDVRAATTATTAMRSALRVILLTVSGGAETAWSLGDGSEGPVVAHDARVGIPWSATDTLDTRVSGVWRSARDGFAVEMRLPLKLAGEKIAVFAVDRSGTPVAGRSELAWLHTASEPLRRRLEDAVVPGLRMSVVDRSGWLLARAGSLAPPPDEHLHRVPVERGLREALYRRLLARPETPPPAAALPMTIAGAPVDAALAGRDAAVWYAAANGDPSLVRAAVPIASAAGALGALVIEQPGERVLLLRDAALAHLLDLTLGAGIVAVLAMVLFAAWLAHRLRRLSRATRTALSPEGRLEPRMPDLGVKDELGDVARSFDALLARLKEYTSYLRTLGDKLSHELRTPLAIVSSSLDNLDAAPLDERVRPYLLRAREGTARLNRTLRAMSEATRVEQSIEQTERVAFDLTRLVRDVGAAYRASFGDERFAVYVPAHPIAVRGSPDLIAQLLDKLLENALEFARPGSVIRIELRGEAGSWQLSVDNEGPTLPPAISGRLFDSMTSGRPIESGPGVPHLGLGLYIARLIAEFHGASIRGHDRSDAAGVVFEVRYGPHGRS